MLGIDGDTQANGRRPFQEDVTTGCGGWKNAIAGGERSWVSFIGARLHYRKAGLHFIAQKHIAQMHFSGKASGCKTALDS
jgi:hypothetical protein